MIEITSVENWQKEAGKANETYLLYKHSTTCPISARAYHVVESFEKYYTTFPILMVKVIESRPLSLHLAEHFSIEHASPQIILIKDGQPIFHTSHNRITGKTIEQAMQDAGLAKN